MLRDSNLSRRSGGCKKNPFSSPAKLCLVPSLFFEVLIKTQLALKKIFTKPFFSFMYEISSAWDN